MDKYILCSIPTVQLEFLLESCGKQNYHADFDGFNRFVCINNDVVSFSHSPKIRAEHCNPFKRYLSSISSASRTCRKVLDLAGLEVKNIGEVDPHDNVFLDVVCTFPSEVDRLLLDGSKRDGLIKRLNKCRYKFFKKFESVYVYNNPNQVMGCSSSLHLWSTECPVLPNAHVHNFIPGFSYSKCVSDFPILDFLEVNFPELLDSVCFVDYSLIRGVKKGRILYEDAKLKQKFIVDSDKYEQLRLKLSNVKRDLFGFIPIVWFDKNFPVDSDQVKRIWSNIVKKEFTEFHWENTVVFDVYIKFVTYKEKSNILHKLQYKCRPPVLDLDLFFRKLKTDFVTGYDSLNFDSLFDHLYYNLEIAIKCSNTNDINRFESYLIKLKDLHASYSVGDFYEWLQFLCKWVTDTRVYGFWKHIKRYLLDPEYDILVEGDICPVCGGDITPVDSVKSCIVDSIIIRHRSYFMVFEFDGG